MRENQFSTWFSHDEYVGVKCMRTLPYRTRKSRTRWVLWLLTFSHMNQKHPTLVSSVATPIARGNGPACWLADHACSFGYDRQAHGQRMATLRTMGPHSPLRRRCGHGQRLVAAARSHPDRINGR